VRPCGTVERWVGGVLDSWRWASLLPCTGFSVGDCGAGEDINLQATLTLTVE
jgi:hypothetical protein